ncbi:MAG: YcxB family protein [Limisphaerales bacterium]
MVTVEFNFTEEHFRELCARYRESGRKRWFILLFRLLVGAFCLYHGYQSRQFGNAPYVAFFAVATLFFLFFPQIMNLFAVSQHRRSPYRDERVLMDFNEEGMKIKSPTTDMQCRWSAFTSAVEFADGLLLFRGPLFHWIPPRIVTSDGGIAKLQELVRDHVDDYVVRAPLNT